MPNAICSLWFHIYLVDTSFFVLVGIANKLMVFPDFPKNISCTVTMFSNDYKCRYEVDDSSSNSGTKYLSLL